MSLNCRANFKRKARNRRRDKRIRERAHKRLLELCAVAALTKGEPGDKTFWEWCKGGAE